MARYIHQLSDWPRFIWNQEEISQLLGMVRHRQGRLLGRMESLGFPLQAEATLRNLTLDVLKSSEIEGKILDADEVRSSIARRLGMDIAGLVPTDRNVDGVVEMMLDATQRYNQELTDERLFGWHAALFPTGFSGIQRLVIGAWRDNTKDDPMQVISGPMGRTRVHFQAPESDVLQLEMAAFLTWFHTEKKIDPVIKSAIAHLWFVTIHPFDDGNGRIARAIADLQLARADGSKQRFYSMSAQIRLERKGYYDILEQTQNADDLNITEWLTWFLECLNRAINVTDDTLAVVIKKVEFWDKYSTVRMNDRQKLMLNKVLDGFDGKLTTDKWAKITKTSKDTALRDVNDLIEKGIILKEKAGSRSTSYVINHSAEII